MVITDEVRDKINNEYKSWADRQYAGKSLKERAEMDQFYTPPDASIMMLEKLDNVNGNVLDPTCGCGGLLAAAIIAGADPKKCYGVELDKKILEVCRERLALLGVPKYNLHLGNALNVDCFDNFTEEYHYNIEKDKVTVGGKKIKKAFVFGYK